MTYVRVYSGHLRSGDSGVRLIEPSGTPGCFYPPCAAVTVKPGDWRVVPIYHIFGSDEMSALSEVTASRQPEPYVGLSHADAEALKVKEGVPLVLAFGTHHVTLAVKILPDLANGLLALPMGLKGVPVVSHVDRIGIAGGAA